MSVKKNTAQITFRAPVDIINQLDELCDMAGCKRSEFFINSIVAQYEQVHNFPEMRNIIAHLRGISEAIERMPTPRNLTACSEEAALPAKGAAEEAELPAKGAADEA